MITDQFKKIINEFGSLFQVGNYPTSDKADSIPMVSETDEWGCMIELSDGVIVDCAVTRFNEDLVYGSFHSDGADAEVFELNKKKTRIFNEFKKRIEEKYDKKFIDEAKAKKKFNEYLNKIFI